MAWGGGGAQVWDEKGAALPHPYCMPPIPSHLLPLQLKTMHFTDLTHKHLTGQGTQHQPWGERLLVSPRGPSLGRDGSHQSGGWGPGCLSPSVCQNLSCLSSPFTALFIYYKYIFYKPQLLFLPCTSSSFLSSCLRLPSPPWAAVQTDRLWLFEGPGTLGLGCGEGWQREGPNGEELGFRHCLFPPCT